MIKTIVIGVGNVFRGDDGFGSAVIQKLKEKGFPGVEMIDAGTPGLDLILTWEGFERVIIVDAADMGLSPGQWQRIPIECSDNLAGRFSSVGGLHSAGVSEAVALGEVLGKLPQMLILFAVQPADLSWSCCLSDQVQPVVPIVCHSIFQELREFTEQIEPPLSKTHIIP